MNITPQLINKNNKLCTYLFLLSDTHDTSFTASGLCVLSTNSDSPVMTKSPMSTDLFQTFQILAELGVESVGNDLTVLATCWKILILTPVLISTVHLSYGLKTLNILTLETNSFREARKFFQYFMNKLGEKILKSFQKGGGGNFVSGDGGGELI